MSDLTFKEAAIAIKDAIVRSRYQAAKLVNKELLGLYYAVGRYVSENSRSGYWDKARLNNYRSCYSVNCLGFVDFLRFR